MLVALACTSPGGTTPASTEVENARVEAPLRSASVDLRIDAGNDAARLSEIVALEVGEAGTLYVLDYIEQRLLSFDKDGNHRWSAGGRGQGPGEFGGAAGLAIDPQGKVWVWDPREQRFSVFRSDGTLEGTFPRPTVGQLNPWPGGFASDGRLIDWAVKHQEAPPGRTMLRPVATSIPGLDTVSFPAVEFTRELRANGRTGVPFGPGLVVSLDRAGGLLFAHTEAYKIFFRSLDGDTLLRFSLQDDPKPVTTEELDSVIRLSRTFSPDLWLDPGQVPEVKPVIRRIFATPDGARTYVVPDVSGYAVGSVLDVFDAAGVFIDRYLLPEPLEVTYPLPVARGGFVYYASIHPVTGLAALLRVRIDVP